MRWGGCLMWTGCYSKSVSLLLLLYYGWRYASDFCRPSYHKGQQSTNRPSLSFELQQEGRLIALPVDMLLDKPTLYV